MTKSFAEHNFQDRLIEGIVILLHFLKIEG